MIHYEVYIEKIMLRNPVFAISAVSAYFLAYLLLIFFNSLFNVVILMFSLSPFLIVWMAYIIIRYGKYTGTELKEDEEWGYEDKKKEELGIM
jgi:Ca2+/Na+ antiporter